MRRSFFLAVVFSVVQVGLMAQVDSALSPRNANYTMRVRLDVDNKLLEGSATISWTNITEQPTSELWFHLYYNAWRNTKSTWLREDSLRRSRSFEELEDEDWGWSDVGSIRLIEDTPLDLTSEARFASPDDGNPDDRTVMVVPLPEPVTPGETIEVAVDWTAKIPRTFARTGFRGNFFFIAQWFPKLGVLQEDGIWNCHQFHAGTEFFSDYGVYDVQITVPTGWKVGATGLGLGTTENSDGTSTHRYKQADVHDFAWTTSPDYREARDRFEHPGLKSVEMRLLYQPEHEGQVARHFAAAKAALQHYGTWYGEYPYDQITLIDPAYGSGAGGMEYPTLFTCGTRYWNPAGGGSPEGVTVHEAGHQFWFGIVGNNEFENAWIDEGLNTFSTARTMDAAFGESFYVARFFGGFLPLALEDVRRPRMTQGNRIDSYRAAARSDAQSTQSYLYFPGSGGRITYDKTALWLSTLERTLGWETLQQIMSTFFERWKFRHPTPDDFFAIANEVSGQDLTPFFDQVHRSSAVFDYAIQSVDSRPVEFFGQLPETETGSNSEFRTRVVVRRNQDGIFPVDVLLRFEDGEEVVESWDGKGEWTLIEVVRASKLDYAVVDPEHKLLLDISRTNNSKRVNPRNVLPANKWASKWMIWLQDYMQTLAFLF